MNTKQPNVRFTFEIENRNSFSFLDTKIIRNTEKKLLKDQFTVYRKSAFSGVFTNCKSFITMASKNSAVGECYFAVFQNAVPTKSFTRKLSRLKEIFMRNSYSVKFIGR